MKKFRKLKKTTTTLFVACMVGGAAFSVTPLIGQTSTQDKINLMSSALRAREAGDLPAAKRNLEELIVIAPDDPNVQRLLNSVNEDIARQQAGERPIYGQAAAGGSSAQPATSASAKGSGDASDLLSAHSEEQAAAVKQAREAIKGSQELAKSGRYAEAYALIDEAEQALPVNTATVRVHEDLVDQRAAVLFQQTVEIAHAGDMPQARLLAADYYAIKGENSRDGRRLRSALNDPELVNLNEVSSGFIRRQEEVEKLLLQGRAQYLYGDYEGAMQSFSEVEAIQPDNREAKAFQMRIGEELNRGGYLDRSKTRSQMLEEVNRAWQRPKVFQRDRTVDASIGMMDPIREKLQTIVIPRVAFEDVPLRRVVDTLSEYSLEYDPAGRGVNIVLYDQRDQDVRVTITLRDFDLERVLEFVTRSVNYQFDVEDGAVVIRRGESVDGGVSLTTDFFPISRGTVIRLTGLRDPDGGGASNDPFAVQTPSSGPSAGDEAEALRSFFQRAGVPFDTTPGANLAFDGTQLIVTQTPRNMERLRNILRRYDTTEQVEIEAKFLEVQQGALEELGVNWNVSTGSGRFGTVGTSGDSLRSLSSLAVSSSSQAGTISRPSGDIDINNSAPSFPGQINLGQGTAPLGILNVGIGGAQVQAVIRALEQQSGTDLMSAPKITVLNGKTAEIVVAQELRYPTSYGDIQSEVGTAGGTGTGSAGVTITAGTPQDFETRRVGVEMEVTPTVEDGDKISLRLEPRVTEFEGFVEYGGMSVAIQGDTTVVVPSGFFQPIFSVRQIRTEVTIFDGATVVMGGLTREEVRTIHDKVPVLGDIPLLGRLFSSKGETSQKRNLLIFVTANLISPGGSPTKQDYRTVRANSLFQNPIIVTPGGAVNRGVELAEE